MSIRWSLPNSIERLPSQSLCGWWCEWGAGAEKPSAIDGPYWRILLLESDDHNLAIHDRAIAGNVPLPPTKLFSLSAIPCNIRSSGFSVMDSFAGDQRTGSRRYDAWLLQSVAGLVNLGFALT